MPSNVTKSLVAASALLLSLVCPTVASAQSAGGAMQKFFNDSKVSYSNTTGPGLYESQSLGTFTMGSYVSRAPQETINLGGVQLPQISAGCGGIDVHTGGFSFISGDEIEDFMKAVMQNAKGFAMSLAIKLVDSQIDASLSENLQRAREIMSTTTSSCEAATALVGTLASHIPATQDHACRALGATNGKFSDWVEGRSKCATPSENSSVRGTLTPEQKKELPDNINYAYRALEKQNDLSQELRELVMALSGTIIVRTTGTDNTQTIPYPPVLIDEALMNVLLRGGTYDINRCVEGDSDCLTMSLSTLEIASDQSFNAMVQDYIGRIHDHMLGDASGFLDDDLKAFINETRLPIVRAMNTHHRVDPANSRAAVMAYSEVIAMEMLMNWLQQLHGRVEIGLPNIKGGTEIQIDMFRNNLAENTKKLQAHAAKVARDLATWERYVDRLSEMDARFAANSTERLAEMLDDKTVGETN